jgi:lipopolysaccharide cholinephosphotransferase
MGEPRRRNTFTLTGRNRARAQRLLLEIVEVLDEAGIDYTLDAGTLLGIVRDGDLIPWDNDIDITIPHRELPKLLGTLNRFRLRRRWISKRFFRQSSPYWKQGDYRAIKIRNRKLLLFKGPVHADLYIKYRVGDVYYWSSAKMICKADAEHFDGYELLEYRGTRLKVPARYADYLTLVYGDWRTPVRRFNASADDGSIIGPESGGL